MAAIHHCTRNAASYIAYLNDRVSGDHSNYFRVLDTWKPQYSFGELGIFFLDLQKVQEIIRKHNLTFLQLLWMTNNCNAILPSCKLSLYTCITYGKVFGGTVLVISWKWDCPNLFSTFTVEFVKWLSPHPIHIVVWGNLSSPLNKDHKTFPIAFYSVIGFGCVLYLRVAPLYLYRVV